MPPDRLTPDSSASSNAVVTAADDQIARTGPIKGPVVVGIDHAVLVLVHV